MERIRLTGDPLRTAPVREWSERPAEPSLRGSFRESLAAARKAQWNERLDRALERLDQFGSELAERRTLEDLKRYRMAVAELIRDLTSQMVQVRVDLEWDSHSWEQRTLVTLRRVNEEVERLAQMVLDHEKDRLAILEKLGEIKGLLLDVRL